MPDIRVEVIGLQAVQRKMLQVMNDMSGPPMVQGMKKAAVLVFQDSQKRVPVDTGKLKAALAPEVEVHGKTIVGIVGVDAKVKYGKYVELGTGPHWPPLEAIEGWAGRHGLTAYQAALAVSRSGTKAHKFLEGALEANEDKIVNLVGDVVTSIVVK